jgi:hypothetical protein
VLFRIRICQWWVCVDKKTRFEVKMMQFWQMYSFAPKGGCADREISWNIQLWSHSFQTHHSLITYNTIITKNIKWMPSVFLWVGELMIFQSILQSMLLTQKHQLKNI